jgi:hypothetical protein
MLVDNALTYSKLERRREPLRKRISRVKARWLRRVMYCEAKHTEKILAFVIFDHLNCVTLDAWPSQRTIASFLHCSTKTVTRAADGLERLQLVKIARPVERGALRYAPTFAKEDWDIDDPNDGHGRPADMDGSVPQSSSSIHSKSTSIGGRRRNGSEYPSSKYRPAERGKWEVALATRLGSSGFEVLARLALIDDDIVARLCRAFCDGELELQELEAAKLAAHQSARSLVRR